MFERFTDPARNVVVLAQEISRSLDHDYIGTEHILAALAVDDERSPAAVVLDGYGLSRALLTEDIEAVVGRGHGAGGGHVPFTPDAKKLLELSLRESLDLQHDDIGTEHILLGIVRLRQSVGAQLLVRRGVDLDAVRRDVLARVAPDPAPPRQRRGLRARIAEARIGPPSLPKLDRCSFCGRPQPAVDVLLSGRGDARICDRCVAAATAIVDEVRAGAAASDEPDEPPDEGPRLAEPP